MKLDTSRSKILLVDDDPAVGDFVKHALADLSETDCTASAEAAREELRARKYALALVDVFLPGDDGISLMTEIRRHHPGTKILVFTGQPSAEVTRSVVQRRADDYLEKPFTPNEIREAVRRLTAPERPMSRFDEVCQYIRRHLSEDLRLATVAARFQMQPSSFSQWFNSEVSARDENGGYKSFIISARVERAETLLATTNMLIKEIAHAVGFSSHQLLNQHFQERHGISPSQWRERQTNSD